MGEKSKDEINLRDLIGMLLKHKLLILVILLVSLMLSVIYVYFIAVPVYSTDVEVGVMGINTGVSAFDEVNNSKVFTDILFAEMSGPKFIRLLARNLQDSNINVNERTLKNAITMHKGKDGKTIFIQARYSKKEELVPIINTAVRVMGREASDYLVEQIQQQMVITENQIKLCKAKTNEALTKYEGYISNQNSSSELQSDVDVAEAVLGQLKANLVSDNYGPGKSKTQLEQEIEKLEEEVNVLTEKLSEASIQYSLYKEELESSSRIYNSLNEEYYRLKFAQIYYTDNSNLEILAGPAAPGSAIWPNKKQIVLASLVLGIGVAFLTVLTIELNKVRK